MLTLKNTYFIDFVDGSFQLVLQSDLHTLEILHIRYDRSHLLGLAKIQTKSLLHFGDLLPDIVSRIDKLFEVRLELYKVLCDVLTLLVDHGC